MRFPGTKISFMDFGNWEGITKGALKIWVVAMRLNRKRKEWRKEEYHFLLESAISSAAKICTCRVRIIALCIDKVSCSRYSTSPTGSENHLSPLRFQTFNRKVFWNRNEARWFSDPVSEVLSISENPEKPHMKSYNIVFFWCQLNVLSYPWERHGSMTFEYPIQIKWKPLHFQCNELFSLISWARDSISNVLLTLSKM